MTKWVQCSDWVGTQIEDKFVMLHIELGHYVALNETASEAWRLLETPQDAQSLAAGLIAKFDVDEVTCVNSVTTLTRKMTELGMITPAE
jgi:hypothetical protein